FRTEGAPPSPASLCRSGAEALHPLRTRTDGAQSAMSSGGAAVHSRLPTPESRFPWLAISSFRCFRHVDLRRHPFSLPPAAFKAASCAGLAQSIHFLPEQNKKARGIHGLVATTAFRSLLLQADDYSH